MSTRGGKLDRFVEQLREVETGRGVDNAPITEWVRVRFLKAGVSPGAVAERHDGQQQFASRSMVFTTRWFSDIRATDRLRFDSQIYDVEGFPEIGRRVGLAIHATWRQGDE